MAVSFTMMVGIVISIGVILPIHTIGDFATGEPVADVISGAFVNEVRFAGAGAIAEGAVWTLLKMLRPIIKGSTEALGSASDRRQGQLVDITQRDIPFPIVVGTIVVMLLPLRCCCATSAAAPWWRTVRPTATWNARTASGCCWPRA